MVQHFWRLQSPASQRKRAEWDDEAVELESVKCPINPMHQHPGKRLTDLTVVLADDEVEDFVWTWYSDCLVQARTLKLLHKCGFRGFEVRPVTARFKRSSARPPALWELVLTGWAGMAPVASGIRLDESKSCLACGSLKYTGLVHPERLIDETKWDGSDFFMVWPFFPHQQELGTLTIPLEGTSTESEIRLAQAQLVGWLEGLFHGIQATLFTQQMQAQRQFEEMRQRRALEMSSERASGGRPMSMG